MSYPISKSSILTDLPALQDTLDFQPYVDSLVEIIGEQATGTPLSIGIFGQWGSGKTSLMKLVQGKLLEYYPDYISVWFNAWKYDREEIALWRALILRTLDGIRPRHNNGSVKQIEELTVEEKELIKDLDRLETSVYKTIEWTELGDWTIDWGKAITGTAEGAAEIALSLVPGGTPLVNLLKKIRETVTDKPPSLLTEAFQRNIQEFHREQLRSVEQFVFSFENIVQEYIVKKRSRLIVFIDDLDRCMLDRTIEVLEAIKLFLDVPGCIFVLGVDPQRIRQAICQRYQISNQSNEGAEYLEKIIQLPFALPDIENQAMKKYVGKLNVEYPSPECIEVFALGLAPNPRQIKRTVNIFLLLWKIKSKRFILDGAALGNNIDSKPHTNIDAILSPIRLAKIVAIQQSHPELYEFLKLTPRYLKELEDYYSTERLQGEIHQDSVTDDSISDPRVNLPYQLKSFIDHRPRLRELLTLFLNDEKACFSPLTIKQLHLFFTLAGSVETESRSIKSDFRPEMIDLPAQSFTMGSSEKEIVELGYDYFQYEIPNQTIDLPAYKIGRFQITNLEYQVFVKERNYLPPLHWENDTFPKGLADHPVVYVSWKDAGEYCLWLSEVTNESFRLPSEAEWERAARGTDGRYYPWGNSWDAKRANTIEEGPHTTTPVGQYSPQGNSPIGCVDMAGNVNEWTNDWFRNYSGGSFKPELHDSKYRVLRGGSWQNDAKHVRCAGRGWAKPDERSDTIGFRVVSVTHNSDSLQEEQ